MTIGLVIPTLNEERALPFTLPRTADLGFDELIVVDGGSTDQTRDIVQSFTPSAQPSALSPIRLLTSPPGRARQMNAGAAVSTCEVLLFLHADTHLPQKARQVIQEAMTNPSCVGGRFDVRFDRDSVFSRMVSSLMNFRSRLSGIATGDQAIFVRRTVFERLGGFSDIPLMEDVEFMTRLKREGRIAALRSTVVSSFRRWEMHGPMRTILLMWALRFLYWLGVSPHRLQRFYGRVR